MVGPHAPKAMRGCPLVLLRRVPCSAGNPQARAAAFWLFRESRRARGRVGFVRPLDRACCHFRSRRANSRLAVGAAPRRDRGGRGFVPRARRAGSPGSSRGHARVPFRAGELACRRRIRAAAGTGQDDVPRARKLESASIAAWRKFRRARRDGDRRRFPCPIGFNAMRDPARTSVQHAGEPPSPGNSNRRMIGLRPARGSRGPEPFALVILRRRAWPGSWRSRWPRGSRSRVAGS